MDFAPYAIGALIILCVGYAIWVAEQGSSGASVLKPLGSIIAIVGLAGAAWVAVYYDVTVQGYDGDDIVNLDAVGVRTIYFIAATAAFLFGTILAATGHVIDSLRPRIAPVEPTAEE